MLEEVCKMGKVVDYDYDRVMNYIEYVASDNIYRYMNSLQNFTDHLDDMEENFHNKDGVGAISRMYNFLSNSVGENSGSRSGSGLYGLGVFSTDLLNTLYEQAKNDKAIAEANMEE